MRFRCIFFPITIIRGLISIGLFALLLSGSLVFAQDSSQNIGSEIKGLKLLQKAVL
jgi:hypothetical protein